MKIIEKNTESFSLKQISICFTKISSQEQAKLDNLLYRVRSKTILANHDVLAFLTIYELEDLIKAWPTSQEKLDLERIFKRHQIIWSGQNFSFDLTLNPIVYSIVNVTPDSFYDGAEENLNLDFILQRVEQDLQEGAQVIELGGKSSRPGYADISPEEEWLRLAQPLQSIRKAFPEAVIAIDTDEAYVMRRVLDAGADIINDIDGFDTPEKLHLMQEYQPALVAMNNGRAGMNYADNVYQEIPAYFAEKQKELNQFDIADAQICVDPGVGFSGGTTGVDSLQRVKTTELLTSLGLPVMIAISRKSFMTNLLNMEVDERLLSTLILENQMMMDGGRVLRVHDVAATHRLIENFKIYQKY
ncbi:dihydropteroate synthase [Lactococcus formosensis]|uniref:dihydropteroate synthase n=1 Tax=Lactococcus formosensis TaxID=1281486 RepID=UPI0024352102|nr:dihydropteroate synthase [Lactococcus formosensis]MDG6119724.1 dihydropteroate synthase [Lactococcus formosensis]